MKDKLTTIRRKGKTKSKGIGLPSMVKVACYDIVIEDWDHNAAHGARKYGEFSSIEQRIRLETTTGKYNVVDTFIHEILHAVYWAYGLEDEDKEERIVGSMGTGLTQVFRDNPEVLKYLQEMLKDE